MKFIKMAHGYHIFISRTLVHLDTTSPDTTSPDTTSPDTTSPDTTSPDTTSTLQNTMTWIHLWCGHSHTLPEWRARTYHFTNHKLAPYK
ncbi:MAG: hypothetical protein OXC46_07065 [Thaumarchaeota archaeon]|nr:hypothetical protein [Nitrososphaerota archaeon]